MKSKLITLIYIALLGSLIYFAYPIVKSRYFDQGEIKENLSGEISPDGSDKEATSQEEEDIDSTEDDTDEEIIIPEEESFLEITNKNCENKCADFASDAEKFKYCKQSCGLSPIDKKANSCEAKTGLEKDYCFKDSAVSQKDLKICEQIEDAGIKKTCQNRITEDILNGLGGKAD